MTGRAEFVARAMDAAAKEFTSWRRTDFVDRLAQAEVEGRRMGFIGTPRHDDDLFATLAKTKRLPWIL